MLAWPVVFLRVFSEKHGVVQPEERVTMDMDGFDVEVERFAEYSLSLLIYNEGRDNGYD